MSPLDPLPVEIPEHLPITTQPATNPYNDTLWKVDQTITEIPPDSVGWMVSQGWETTSIAWDTTTKPPTPKYTMERETMNNWAILNSLLGEYTFAYNSALKNNNDRYNEVILEWTELLAATTLQMTAQTSEQNAHVSLLLSDISTYMDEVDTLIVNNESDLDASLEKATVALTALDAKLTALESNAGSTKSAIETLIIAQGTKLTAFITAYELKQGELTTNYDAHLLLIKTLLEDVDTNLDDFESEQLVLTDNMANALDVFSTKAVDLFTTVQGFLDTVEEDIGDFLTAIDSDYTAVETDVEALLTDGVNALTIHKSDYNAVLATLLSDYTTHENDAEAFLVDLGTTELARINEEFNATLSAQVQILVDQGLYSGDAATDITARNVRDRDEQIQKLNDRLAREKLENEHALYTQQVVMRQGTMTGKDRMHGVEQGMFHYRASQAVGLHNLQQAMRERVLAGKDRIYMIKEANIRFQAEIRKQVHSAEIQTNQLIADEAAKLHQFQLAVNQFESGQRDQLLTLLQGIVKGHMEGLDRQHIILQEIAKGEIQQTNIFLEQLQSAVNGFLTGKERFASLTTSTASTLAEHRHKMILEKMNEYMFRIQGQKDTHEANMRLMAYQLDERNKLMVGLYGFVERREDVGPSIEDLAKICTSLGDSGGGWLTP